MGGDELVRHEGFGLRNRQRVMAEILFDGPVARGQIASRIGLSAAAVSRITREFIDADLVLEDAGQVAAIRRPGRRFVGLRVNPQARFVLGVAINAFRQDVTIADLSNTTVAARRLDFANLADAEKVLEICAQALEELISEADTPRERIIGCGVAISGAIEPSNRAIKDSPALGWQDLPVGELLERKLNMPVFVDNIPNAKNLAAYSFGISRNMEDVVLFNASLVIGCSLFLEGRLYRGAGFNAGLIGQQQVPDANGNLKPLDDLCGGSAVVRELFGGTHPFGREQANLLAPLIEANATHETTSRDAFAAAGRSLAHVVHNTINTLHPQRVLLSGPLMDHQSYREATFSTLKATMGASYVAECAHWMPMSSHSAAQSLAIYQALSHGLVRGARPRLSLAG